MRALRKIEMGDKPEARTLLENLLLFQKTKCSDPLDKVYSLLSMSPVTHVPFDNPIYPDYNKSMIDLTGQLVIVFYADADAGHGLRCPAFAPHLASRIFTALDLSATEKYQVLEKLRSWRADYAEYAPRFLVSVIYMWRVAIGDLPAERNFDMYEDKTPSSP